MDHHVGDLKLAEVQQPAEHVAVLLFDLPFVMQTSTAPRNRSGRQDIGWLAVLMPSSHIRATIAVDSQSAVPAGYMQRFHRARTSIGAGRRVDGDGLGSTSAKITTIPSSRGGVEHADIAEPAVKTGRQRRRRFAEADASGAMLMPSCSSAR